MSLAATLRSLVSGAAWRARWGSVRLRAHQRLRVLRPRGPAEWATSVLLAAVLGAYLVHWARGNSGMLFDPLLQTDDARTVIFPFHRHAPGAPLADDPIALEMLDYVPYGVRWLYALIVPAVGVLVATKVVQALALAVLLAAAVVLATTPGLGLPAAGLLLFFVLRDVTQVDRIAGGLPRAFAFPCFALWIAGAMARRRGARAAGVLLAALSYPSTMLMLLAAEALLLLRGLGSRGVAVALRRARWLGGLTLACAVLIAPAVGGDPSRGPLHTLEQARGEPAFGPAGRLRVLPLPDARREVGPAGFGVLGASGGSPWPAVAARVRDYDAPAALALGAGLAVIVIAGWAPVPWVAVALLAGVWLTYGVAHVFAFRLYAPERVYSFGMHAAVTALVVGMLARVGARWRHRRGRLLRSLAATAVIAGTVVALGDGVRDRVGMTIDRRPLAPLWDFFAGLPSNTRVASHPMDGDDIPLWSARANMGGFETLQPWFVGSWARQRARTEDTLGALYATDRAEVLAYARRHRVTHLLLNADRYAGDVAGRAGSFEPLTAYARKLLQGRRATELVLAAPPQGAVVFRLGKWSVVDVARLEQAWAE
ncbi:MAG: hypothetical protein IT376_02130 [Polyangiaceae bacterium]|nr:hypothetical protein [Polyangiaceae bacterium]